jgi:hypothetical protein
MGSTGTGTLRRGRIGRAGAVVAVAVAALVLTPVAAGASVSVTPDATAGVTGTVYAVAQVGTRIIVGGDFTAVGGQPRRNLAAIRADGTVDPTFHPDPDGIVYAVAGNADGTRVFAGGTFANVAGAPRANLAALDPATGGLVPGWDASTNDGVLALAVSGNRLYAGGRFTTIGGQTRRRLAAVDTTTAAVALGFNPWPDWTVRSVAVSPDGTKVYAVGGFTAIGGAPRKQGAAELLASSGAVTAWDPTNGGVGLASALTPDGSRFYFSTPDNRLWAYDPAVSNSPVYVLQSSGDTQAIAASATEVYFGGHFGQVWYGKAKIKRAHIASIRVSDGAITSWNPGVAGNLGTWATAVTPTALLVGGDFHKVGNKSQPGFARFSGTP